MDSTVSLVEHLPSTTMWFGLVFNSDRGDRDRPFVLHQWCRRKRSEWTKRVRAHVSTNPVCGTVGCEAPLTQLAWGVAVWQQAVPGSDRPGNHRKMRWCQRAQLRKAGKSEPLASQNQKRRCRTGTNRSLGIPRASWSVGGNRAHTARVHSETMAGEAACTYSGRSADNESADRRDF